MAAAKGKGAGGASAARERARKAVMARAALAGREAEETPFSNSAEVSEDVPEAPASTPIEAPVEQAASSTPKLDAVPDSAGASPQAAVTETIETAPPATPAPVAETPSVSPVTVDGSGSAGSAPAATPPAPADGTRELARPFTERDGETAARSMVVAPAVYEACDAWRRARRSEYRRPAVSWLIAAAFRHLETEPESLRRFADVVPESVRLGKHMSMSMNLPLDIIETMQDVAFEVQLMRGSRIKTWHVLSGAVALQLAAEGIEVAWE